MAAGEALVLGLSQHQVVVLPGPYSRDIRVLRVSLLRRTLVCGVGVILSLFLEGIFGKRRAPSFFGVGLLGGNIDENLVTVGARAFSALLPNDLMCAHMLGKLTFCVGRSPLAVAGACPEGAAIPPKLL